jgi:hypothetical protein
MAHKPTRCQSCTNEGVHAAPETTEPNTGASHNDARNERKEGTMNDATTTSPT